MNRFERLHYNSLCAYHYEIAIEMSKSTYPCDTPDTHSRPVSMCHVSGQKLNQDAITSVVELRSLIIPDSKVHGANMRPIWGPQDPGGPHVGPMNISIWDGMVLYR